MTDVKRLLTVVLDSVLAPKSAAYAAGPLDTGRLFYETVALKGRSGPGVRRANQERLSEFVRLLRLRLACPVIDPGLLVVDGWCGREYGDFFLSVLDRYVKEVWFMDGWEYSNGSTKEFFFCHACSIPCFDSTGSPLCTSVGRDLIEDAATHVESLGIDASKLRSRLR
jgi:hypothetical protein